MAKQYITATRSDLYLVDPANVVIVGVDISADDLATLTDRETLAAVTHDAASNDTELPAHFVASFGDLVDLSIADSPKAERHAGNAQPIEVIRVDCPETHALAHRDAKGGVHPYMLIANYGRKRIRGARLANAQRGHAPAAPGYVWLTAKAADKRSSETAHAMRRFIENGARLNHDPIAEAKELVRVSKVLNLPLAQLAEARGESEQGTLNKLGLATLAPEIQAEISAGNIVPSVGYQLSKLQTHELQTEALEAAKESGDGKVKIGKVKEAVAARNPRARKPPTNKPADITPASKPVETSEPASKPTQAQSRAIAAPKPENSKPTTAEIREMIAMLGSGSPGAIALLWALGETDANVVLATRVGHQTAMAI